MNPRNPDVRDAADPGEDPRVLEVASSVGDGSPVDWDDHAARARDPHEQKLLDSLKILAEVARVHGGGLAPEDLFGAVSPAPAGPPPPAAPLPAAPRSAAAAEMAASPGPAVAPAPPTRWGPLTIGESLGHGGFGDVYRAHDPNLQRDVAVKFLRPLAGRAAAATQQLLAEARRLARVRHPNVVHVYGAEEHDGRAGMWMELVQGESLSQSVDRQGAFGEREALLFGLDLCRALAALHGAGLIHRDVKAHNVLRETGGRLVLMDLGAGAEAAPATRAATPRVLAPHVGTPVYAAPELLRGEPASVRSDLYALGVLLYHLVTCAYPVMADSLGELRRAHADGRRQPLRDLCPEASAEFVRIVERLIAPAPVDRYASAGELEGDLQRALGVSQPSARRPRPRRAIWAAAVGALLVALAVTRLPQRAWDAATGSGSYAIEATLFRESGALPERLQDGATVAEGDGLFLRLQASRELHLYVLDIDAAGQAFLLFPLKDHVPANPLPAGQTHELPGVRSGAADVWVITGGEAGDREHLLLVGSPDPLPELERLAAGLGTAGANDGGSYPSVPADHLRGISGVRRRAPSGLAAGAASDALLRWLEEAVPLRETGESARSVWVRRVVLRHSSAR